VLGDQRVAATIPVRDPAQARSFYEGKLGLRVSRELADGSIEYACGRGTSMYTYPTEENAGRSPATLASFEVEDAEATVSEMRDRGITFEEYDLPGLKTEGGIAEVAGSKGAGSRTRTATSWPCSSRRRRESRSRLRGRRIEAGGAAAASLASLAPAIGPSATVRRLRSARRASGSAGRARRERGACDSRRQRPASRS
jgi:catechol 2,3-dioxygenase-like lactoylglutathione lyase family enzyme